MHYLTWKLYIQNKTRSFQKMYTWPSVVQTKISPWSTFSYFHYPSPYGKGTIPHCVNIYTSKGFWTRHWLFLHQLRGSAYKRGASAVNLVNFSGMVKTRLHPWSETCFPLYYKYLTCDCFTSPFIWCLCYLRIRSSYSLFPLYSELNFFWDRNLLFSKIFLPPNTKSLLNFQR